MTNMNYHTSDFIENKLAHNFQNIFKYAIA